QQVQTLVTQNKKLLQRLDKLSAEWAEREANRLLSISKNIDGLKFCQAKYTQNEENELISTINKITEQAPNAVVLLILARDSTRILVGAGKQAVKSGIHAGKLATQLASLIGGGGGGKDYFGQGGGTKSNVDQILTDSESLLNSMLKK
ncbi:MAG TPA: DHHA1 domain-containing protein, partial [Candidatus Acidoferrum sp.]|nr:DHHA1 domain-containing protein [Candidatus Acidoferrum sp.]